MRDIRFRFWDAKEGKWLGKDSSYWKELTFEDCRNKLIASMRQGNIIAEQYTGLKDKNGKEIYENCELDGRYRVEYIAPKFVGKDMIKGDIIELYDNKFTITKEHCEISQNSERGIN